jgi:16S rRNA (guanine527-N7)-methyltransferase
VNAVAARAEVDQVSLSAQVRDVFGERAPLADAYARFLVTDGIPRGVLGPRESARVWERHLFNCAALAPLVPQGVRVVDLGSGAGLPGIPLAIARPDLTVVLLEPLQRRVSFLTDCLAALGLGGVEVVRGRAEAGLEPRAEVVVARAVSSLDRLVSLSAYVVVAPGTLLALKGESAAEEVAALPVDRRTSVEILTVPAPGGPATVVRVIGPTAGSAGGGGR